MLIIKYLVKLLEYEMSNVTLLWFLKDRFLKRQEPKPDAFVSGSPLSSAPLKKFLPEKRLMCSKKASHTVFL